MIDYMDGGHTMKMTSAYANKLLKKLSEDKLYWIGKESDGCTYVAATDEEPIIPDYDYSEVAAKIRDIDEKVVIIKHAVNITNATNKVLVDAREMTIDEVLVRMAQLNSRKSTLGYMRKQEPMKRINSGVYGRRKTAPEYRYINYSLDIIKEEYEAIDSEIAKMQMALDKYNQTVEFEVNIEL